MNNTLRELLITGIAATVTGCYSPDVATEQKIESTRTPKIESISDSRRINPEERIHYLNLVGTRMGTFNGETGMKGTLEFDISPDEDYFLLTKKTYWQNEVPGKSVPIHSEVAFRAKFETPRKLEDFVTVTLFDDEWYTTDVGLDRETAGNSSQFRRAESLYLALLEELETPTINGRMRVAPIYDGGL